MVDITMQGYIILFSLFLFRSYQCNSLTANAYFRLFRATPNSSFMHHANLDFFFDFLSFMIVCAPNRDTQSEFIIVSTATKQLRVWDSTNHWTGWKSFTGIPNNMSLLTNCSLVVIRVGIMWSEPSRLWKQRVNRATSRTLGLVKQCVGSFTSRRVVNTEQLR